MLQQHDEQPQTTTPVSTYSPIANLRVSPEELAQAISSLENKREATGHAQSGTIAIGDAIRELGLQMTPEEVYREIRENQTRASIPTVAATTPVLSAKPKRKRRRLIAIGLVAGVGFTLWMARSANVVYAPPMAMEAPFPAMATSAMAGVDLKPFDAFVEGEDRYASLDTLYELANGKKTSSVKAATFQMQEVGKQQWKVITLNGELYVRGWTFQSAMVTLDSGNVEKDASNFFSAPYTNADMTPLTVPLKQFAQLRDPTYLVHGGIEGVRLPKP